MMTRYFLIWPEQVGILIITIYCLCLLESVRILSFDYKTKYPNTPKMDESGEKCLILIWSLISASSVLTTCYSLLTVLADYR